MSQIFKTMVAAGIFWVLAPISAQALVVHEGTVAAGSVDYIYFHNNTVDEVSITVKGDKKGPSDNKLDRPNFRLFVDDGSAEGALTGTQIVSFTSYSKTAEVVLASLDVGNYVLAVGRYLLTELEARTGNASTPSKDSDYKASFGSDITLNGAGATPVSEPTALALFGLGLVGLGLVSRRRKQAR